MKGLLGGDRPVRDVMTPVPNAVTVEQSVGDACARMHTLGVHHLPVVSGDQLMGIVTERDLAPIIEYGQIDPSALAVGDVVSPDFCLQFAADTPLITVVQAMLDRAADCCAVIDQGKLVGILTNRDTLRLLLGVLYDGGRHAGELRPSAVRKRILSEHQVLKRIYERTGDLARQVLDRDPDADAPLREQCRDLYETLLRHIELENTILAPALFETDAFGPLRAEELVREHRRQQQVLLAALDASDADSALELARSVTKLIADLTVDMAHEERALLHPDLLRDDPVSVDAASG